jgi:hypothetical protein
MRLLLILGVIAVVTSGCQMTVGGTLSKSYSTGKSDDRRP